MNGTVALLAMGAFIGGLLVVSRTIAWVVGLWLLLHPSAPAQRQEFSASLVAQLLLHSGLWSLLLALGGVYYVATYSRPAFLWAILGGFAAAFAVLAFAIILGQLRQRHARPPVPLTPQRLLAIRRRFFWITTLFFGGGMAASMLYLTWGPASSSIVFFAVILALCLGGGWVFAWFMWQWFGAALEAAETARQRRERDHAA